MVPLRALPGGLPASSRDLDLKNQERLNQCRSPKECLSHLADFWIPFPVTTVPLAAAAASWLVLFFRLPLTTGDPGNDAAEETLPSSLDSERAVETDLAEPELMEPVPGEIKE